MDGPLDDNVDIVLITCQLASFCSCLYSYVRFGGRLIFLKRLLSANKQFLWACLLCQGWACDHVSAPAHGSWLACSRMQILGQRCLIVSMSRALRVPLHAECCPGFATCWMLSGVSLHAEGSAPYLVVLSRSLFSESYGRLLLCRYIVMDYNIKWTLLMASGAAHIAHA